MLKEVRLCQQVNNKSVISHQFESVNQTALVSVSPLQKSTVRLMDSRLANFCSLIEEVLVRLSVERKSEESNLNCEL